MPRISDIDRLALVVGAPRCGTTTLSRLLRGQPQICFPIVKEPHYFALNDLRGLDSGMLRARVEGDYLDRFFPDCAAGADVAADCSVTYLYTPEQLVPILDLWPQSRFVISVRDPMQMLPSLHKRLLFIGDEDLPRFEDAWAASRDRAAGRRIPRRAADPRWLRYDEAGRFGTYVERLFAAVGRDRCKVVVFDDLVADPVAVCRDVLDFYGLDQPEHIDVPHERGGREARSLWLQRLLKRPPKPLFDLVAPTHHRIRTGSDVPEAPARGAATILSLRKRLLRLNRRPARRQPIDPAVQQEIRDACLDDVRLLGRLIGRNLDHWLQVTGGDAGAGATPVRAAAS